jgi:hypothetical protein
MAQKASEWYFGLQHDEILAQTLRARERAQRRLEAKISKDKGGGDQAKARGAKIAVTDLARVLKEHINHRYDDIFDAFTDVDLNGNGTLRYASVGCAPAFSLPPSLSLPLSLVVSPGCLFAIRACQPWTAIATEGTMIASTDTWSCLHTITAQQQSRIPTRHRGNGSLQGAGQWQIYQGTARRSI